MKQKWLKDIHRKRIHSAKTKIITDYASSSHAILNYLYQNHVQNKHVWCISNIRKLVSFQRLYTQEKRPNRLNYRYPYLYIPCVCTTTLSGNKYLRQGKHGVLHENMLRLCPITLIIIAHIARFCFLWAVCMNIENRIRLVIDFFSCSVIASMGPS